MKTIFEFRGHKLTESQVKCLFQMRAGVAHKHGNTLDALKRRGMVEELPNGEYPITCTLTKLGDYAAQHARALGL